MYVEMLQDVTSILKVGPYLRAFKLHTVSIIPREIPRNVCITIIFEPKNI